MESNRDLLLGDKKNALSSSNFDQKPVQNNKKLVTKNFGKFCLALIHNKQRAAYDHQFKKSITRSEALTFPS